jgi:hypothetical protein
MSMNYPQKLVERRKVRSQGIPTRHVNDKSQSCTNGPTNMTDNTASTAQVVTEPLLQLAEGHPEALAGAGGRRRGSRHPQTDHRRLGSQRAIVPATNDRLRPDRAISAAIFAALPTWTASTQTR